MLLLWRPAPRDIRDSGGRKPKRPPLAGREDLRLSMAGAQTKVPVVLMDDEVALPVPGQPTTHILKPPIKRFPATVENEAFVTQLASTCGPDVTPAMPRLVKDRAYLLVAGIVR
jgi:serine/threonine-protein kinase HipA